MIILSKEEQEQIYKDFITEIFKTEIENHKNGNCNCDLTEGGTGLCNNEFGKSNEKDIRFLANEIFDMVDWQFASSLASELVENYELEVK